jgi:hypothetical protein
MDLGAIQSAISSLQVATGIAKSILDTKTTIEVQGKVIEIQSALLAAQASAIAATTAQFELQEKVRSLEEQLKAFRDWGDQEQRYALVCPWRGPAQAYALRRDEANGEAAHLLCANCFHGKKRVILNPIERAGWVSLVCPSCKAVIDSGLRGIAAPKYADDYQK